MRKHKNNNHKSYILCGIAIFLWGSVSTVGKIFLKDISIIEFLFYMCLFASLTLFLVLVLQKNIHLLAQTSKNNYLRLSLIGLVGILIYNLLYFEALSKTSAINVSIIGYIWPILLIIFSSLFLMSKISKIGWVALILGFMGVFLAASQHLSLNTDPQKIFGDLLTLGSAVIFALFFMLSNKYKVNNYLFMFLAYFSSTLAAGIYILLATGFPQPNPDMLTAALYIGVLPSALGFAFFSEALKIGPSSKIANLAYLTPFISLLYISLILRENPTLIQVIGLIIVIAAVLLEKIVILALPFTKKHRYG